MVIVNRNRIAESLYQQRTDWTAFRKHLKEKGFARNSKVRIDLLALGSDGEAVRDPNL
jgi:hypothetical protein